MKVLTAVSIVLAAPLAGLSLEGPPLTQVIHVSTAYTLPGGTWELSGYLYLPLTGLPGAAVSYGITDGFQLGTWLTGDLHGFPNLEGKLALGQLGPMSLALPFWLAYTPSETTLYLDVSLATSLESEPLSIHFELTLDILPWTGLYGVLGLAYALSDSAALLGELGVPSFCFRVGGLFRPLPGLDLKVWARLPTFRAGARVNLRF